MGKLNLEKILAQTGYTKEEFADKMGITLNELDDYCNGTAQMTADLLVKMCGNTGMPAQDLFINDAGTNSSSKFGAKPINPMNTFDPSNDARTSLVNYIKQGLNEFELEEVREEIENIEKCVKKLRKPKISFAGQSDTGKSTMINTLLGAENMPAKWTPTTSITVHIKHVDDRPAFMRENVWIFGNKNGGEWDDSRLDDEKYCREFLIAKGDFSLLNTFGTHQGENSGQKTASSAVAFIDSDLLKDCDILDVPGYAVTVEDDKVHTKNILEQDNDILLYLSRANGFLQGNDMDYIRKCIERLSPVERKGENELNKLDNLFIIASQAGSVGNGNVPELNGILNQRCHVLCEAYSANGKTLLPLRTKATGYNYTEEDFRKRFFTFEKTQERLCKDFNKAFTSTAEKLPAALHTQFFENLKQIVSNSTFKIKEKVAEWESILENKRMYVELLREIKDKEPARKIEQQERNNGILDEIQNSCTECKQDIQTLFTSIMNEENLVSMMEKHNIKNKKDSKQDFASILDETLSSKIQKILSDKTEEYSDSLDKFLDGYSKSFSNYSIKDIKLGFDATGSFAAGLVGLGALGASAAWLATSVTAWSVFTFGALAGVGSVLAVGGVIGIAIGAVIAAITKFVNLAHWKKNYAKEIIKTYEEQNYLEKIFENVDNYWSDTKESFTEAVNRVEEDWQKHISEMESLADEKNIPVLQKKIAEAHKGLDFFTKMPMPDAG